MRYAARRTLAWLWQLPVVLVAVFAVIYWMAEDKLALPLGFSATEANVHQYLAIEAHDERSTVLYVSLVVLAVAATLAGVAAAWLIRPRKIRVASYPTFPISTHSGAS